MMTMSRLLETVNTEDTCRVHTTFTATVRWLSHLEHSSTNWRWAIQLAQFGYNLLRITIKNELFQSIKQNLLCFGFIKTPIKTTSIRFRAINFRDPYSPVLLKVSAWQHSTGEFMIPYFNTLFWWVWKHRQCWLFHFQITKAGVTLNRITHHSTFNIWN